jgi:CRISPR/Cas system-associated exonuclease Cas4 (RecB family)
LKAHNIGEIYSHFLRKENEKNTKERYVGKEHFYHASGTGTCSRKLYFQSVDKAQPSNLPNNASMRKMRLGTLVHEDVQKSLLLYNNIYNNIINNSNNRNIKENIETKNDSPTVYKTEGEVMIEELSVRGFYDIVEDGSSGLNLYDIKTAADYSFRKVFNTDKPYVMQHQELQLATYGYALKEEYGRLDGMYLLYYNKNTSIMKYKQVPLSMLSSAYMFWANIKKQHSVGLPNFEDGVSPVMKWECDYCDFKDHCSPPANYGRYSHKYTLKQGEI